MAYGGFFMQGLASGLQTGFDMKTKINQWKEQKKQKDELQKKQDEISAKTQAYFDKVQQFQEDGLISDDELLQLNTAFLTAGTDVQELIKGTHDAITKRQTDAYKSDMDMIDSYSEMIDGLDPKNTTGTLETVRGMVTSDKAKRYLDVYEKTQAQKWESAQVSPEQKAYDESMKIANMLPQNLRADYLRSQGIDVPEPPPSTNQASIPYSTAEEAINQTADIPNFDKVPYQDSDGFWHVRFVRTRVGGSKSTTTNAKPPSTPTTPGLKGKATLNEMRGTAPNKTNIPGVPVTGIDITKYEAMSDEELRQAIAEGDQGAIQYAISKGLLR